VFVLTAVPLAASYVRLAVRRDSTLHDEWSRTRVLRLPKS